jgi:hypothetical protein
MPSMEEIEMDRYRARLDKDVAELVDKYMGIMGWDIPEINVDRARSLIVAEVEAAIGRLRSSTK